MKLSIVVPAYNEQESLSDFLKLLVRELKRVTASYEIIVVNDGSSDDTLRIAQALAAKDKHIRLVNLSRNFGKELATTAGISYATGDAVIMIDADGQHPPELIKQFVALWKDGYQVVVGVRKTNQKEGFVKRYGSKLFYHLFNATSDVTLIPGATDYRLIDKAVRDEFVKFTERNRITRGLIDWMGFKRTVIPFDAKERMAGRASYSITKLVKLTLNSFISLSIAPLYAVGAAGVLITLLSFIFGLFILIEQPILSDPLHLRITGTAMIGVLLLFLVGIIMTAQGLLALYLSHIHVQAQNRPLFIVDKQNSANL